MGDADFDDLVLAMFDAFLDGDGEMVRAHVDQHFGTIAAGADGLATVPEPLREDPDAVQAWVQFAVSVGQLLAERGDDRLITRIMSSADNPIVGWQDAMAQAQRLRDDARFAASDDVLRELIVELRAARGSAVDALLGTALGLMGANAFDLGDIAEAMRLTDQALRECERSGDTEGVATYSSNLATIAATVSDTDPATAMRRRLARAQELHDAGRLAEGRTLAMAAVADLTDELAHYRAKAHGLLGMIHYRMGEFAMARQQTRFALEAGRAADDAAAVEIYGANLEVIERVE